MEKYLKSLEEERQSLESDIGRLCRKSESVESEIETTRAMLASFNSRAEVIDVDEEEEQAASEYNYNESESEAPAKPVNRKPVNSKKRSHSFSDDDDDDDNTQATTHKRQRVDDKPSSSLYNHQRLKMVLNNLPINREFTTTEIAEAYTTKFRDQSHFTWSKNLRQYMKEQYIPEGCMRWNEVKAGGSTYTRLKQIPM